MDVTGSREVQIKAEPNNNEILPLFRLKAHLHPTRPA